MSKSGKKIMLVEDNPAHAKLAVYSIQNCEAAAQIEQAADGEEAVQKLRAMAGDLPDLVLLDLKLPRMNGIEVLEAIRSDETLKNITVVMLTSSDSERDMQMAYSNRANGYMVKPVNFSDFDIMMKAACSYWLNWNRRAF
jgi:two-component system, response regulator